MAVDRTPRGWRGLRKTGAGVVSSGGEARIDIPLPAEIAHVTADRDARAMVAVWFEEADRPLNPELLLDFGAGTRRGVSVRLDLSDGRAMQTMLMPRGVKRLQLAPHDGPFFARALGWSIHKLPEAEAPRRRERALHRDGRPGDALVRAPDISFGAGGRIESASSDPHLVWAPDRALEPGWWSAEAVLTSDAPLQPRLYLGGTDGWRESWATDMAYTGPGLYRGVIHIPDRVTRLRFDPMDAPGEAVFRDLTLTRMSLADIAKLGVSLALQRRRRPLFNLGVRTLGLVRSGACAIPSSALGEHGGQQMQAASYRQWRDNFDFRPERDAGPLRARVKAMREPPRFSIIMPTYETPPDLLDKTIGSVLGQIYPHWQLCIADDASPSGRTQDKLREWAARDDRIAITLRKANGNISEATNSAFALAEGDWAALLDHDDAFAPQALARMAEAILDNPKGELFYSDEDKIDEAGARFDPYFKPDFSPDLFYGQNYLNHLTVHSAARIREVGGWRRGYEGSQDYDISLRILEKIGPDAVIHVPEVLYHWRAVQGSTALAAAEKSYAFDAGIKALSEHLERTGTGATAEQAPGLPYYRVRWPVPDPEPLVSLMIPTRDQAGLLRQCVDSIRDGSDYRNWEILVMDNQSEEDETFQLFAEWADDPRIRVIPYDAPFNFAAINNEAVRQARGEIVGLINNDVEAINRSWLSEMVSLAVRPDTGCVGAKLYYSDGRIQHGGVVLGVGGVAGHAHKYFPGDAHGYFSRLRLTQDYSAVTAACLLVRKSVYEEAGGMEEENLKVAFNDVDFCLRVRSLGLRNVWTPYAELYHHESVSRGAETTPEKKARFQREAEYMMRTWATDSAPDPFYSPHLSRTHEDFSLRAPERA